MITYIFIIKFTYIDYTHLHKTIYSTERIVKFSRKAYAYPGRPETCAGPLAGDRDGRLMAWDPDIPTGDRRMKKAVGEILEKTGDRFYRYRRRVLEFKDPEDVHQMRVSGRTLLSYLNALADEKEASRPGFIKLRRPLKKAMGLLGDLRDTDILIEEVGKRSVAMAPERRALVEGWLDQVRVERARLRKRLAAELPESIGPEWKRRMERWIKERSPGLADRASVDAKVARLRKKKERAMKAIRDYPAPDVDNLEFLDVVHEGRIAVKRLRYALNILKVPDSADKDEIDGLKRLQDQLGHIQDMRVWIERLHDRYGDNGIVGEITSGWRTEMLAALRSTGLLNK